MQILCWVFPNSAPCDQNGVLAGSTGTHSVCVCSIHQNAVLLADAIDWDVTYKDLINKVVCDSNIAV